MIPQEITREHVLEALREIDRAGVPKERQAAEYMVVHGGKLYPEKYVVSLASRIALGKELDPHSFSGGKETIRFLTTRGFPIVRKTAWERAVARLGERHLSLPGEPGGREIAGSKAEVTGKFGRVFSPGHPSAATGEDLSAFLDYARKRGWIGPGKTGGGQGGDAGFYRERLAPLLDESRPVADRVDAFGDVELASAILHVTHPDRYGVLSRPVEDALRKAGIFPFLKEGATPGETYAAVNEVLLALAGAAGMDPWALCAVLHAPGEGPWARAPRSLREAFRDATAIAALVREKGLHGKSLAMGPDAEMNRKTYRESVKPAIEEFKGKHGATPNILIKELLDEVLESRGATGKYTAKGFRFVGRVVHAYTWGAITREAGEGEEMAFSRVPQLFVAVTPSELRYGLGYGDHVESAHVEAARTDPQIQRLVREILRENPAIDAFNKPSGVEDPAGRENIRDRILAGDFGAWSGDTILAECHDAGAIPDDVGDRIRSVLSALFPAFEALSFPGEPAVPAGTAAKAVVLPAGPARAWGEVAGRLAVDFRARELSPPGLYFLPAEWKRIASQVHAALAGGKHVILVGPPGTGKSKLAQEICEAYAGRGNFILATASSEWSTYETIGGYRPDREGRLVFHPGLFLRCLRGEDGEPANRWLVIDEINRADIDKAFGAFFSALTGDTVTLPYEAGGKPVRIVGRPDPSLPLGEETFAIHPDWRIVATMNTFDKSSLYEMSYAFMRRFAFVPVNVPPRIDGTLVGEYARRWGIALSEEMAAEVAAVWEKINERRKIGPAIVHDMVRCILHSGSGGWESALVMYVVPQFEGLREEDQREFIRALGDLRCVEDKEYVVEYAREFLGIPRETPK